jgi:thiol-disulfide isomerase/thioredoxin
MGWQMPVRALHIGRCVLLSTCLITALFALPVAPAPAGAATTHRDAPGIDWYAGDVASAFALAGREHKPVFLYWGARWCPPCLQLKSSVFSRGDFIAKTHQFVAVYLDGDDPGAQKWGEAFHVLGYPTVVILRPDRREVTRLSGGMDLSLYADLLDIAENDITPIDEVLARLKANPATLSHGECQRLAYYGWELADYSAEERNRIGASLSAAASRCPGTTPAERARLVVISSSLSMSEKSVAQVSAILADPVIAAGLVDVLEGLNSDFFAAVLAQGPAMSAAFLRDWQRTMDEAAGDPRRGEADQLYAIGTKLEVIRQFSAPAPLPDALAAEVRAQVAAALARRTDPYVRAGVVNAASYVYAQLGDDADEEALLNTELRTSRTPYYYMADLGDLEEKRGHAPAALAWFERAYRDSAGTATRFQWGDIYLGALLRLAPAERERIRQVAGAVLANLDGPDRIGARTRMHLEKLDGRLRQRNAGHKFDADLKEIRRRMLGICAKLRGEDEGLASCRNFLAGAA